MADLPDRPDDANAVDPPGRSAVPPARPPHPGPLPSARSGSLPSARPDAPGPGEAPPGLASARSMASHDATPSPTAPDVDEVTISLGDEQWRVRVLGRSGGSGRTKAPLLLLGFSPTETGAAPAEGQRHHREALVVGAMLEGLSRLALEEALAGSTVLRDRPKSDKKDVPARRRGRRGGATGRRRD
jgi:hypothetical protein